MHRLANKVAVITGGSSGIGKAIAKRFLQEGAKVVIFGRSLEKLQKARKELGDVLIVQGDVSYNPDLLKLFEETSVHFGKIDILVANSGYGERLKINEVNEDNFDYMLNTNYRGLFFPIQHALEHMNNKASIILIASATAHLTFKYHSVYSSTKAAVIQLAKNFAFDLSDRLIRVNSISPGYTNTPAFDGLLKINPNFLAEKAQQIPLKRIGNPEDIANAALFFASDEASYITGASLSIDGGYSVSCLAELQ